MTFDHHTEKYTQPESYKKDSLLLYQLCDVQLNSPSRILISADIFRFFFLFRPFQLRYREYVLSTVLKKHLNCSLHVVKRFLCIAGLSCTGIDVGEIHGLDPIVHLI